VAAISRLLNQTPVEWRERIIQATNAPSLQVTVTLENPLVTPDSEGWHETVVRRFLESQLPDPKNQPIIVRIVERPEDHRGESQVLPSQSMGMHTMGMDGSWLAGHPMQISVHLADGSWASFSAAMPEPTPHWSNEAVCPWY
jgi:hypothetical protein